MSSPFEPVKIGSLELPNRLAMAPMKTAYGTTSGRVTQQLVAYFRRRAEGGVGLVISEPLYVDRRGVEHPRQLGIDDDDKLEGLKHLVEAVHEEGKKIFAHINHGGRAANPKAAGGMAPEAPSKIPCPRTGFEPEELSGDRIGEIVQAFAEAADRARAAGFDGVELQFGLGYLVSQFLSPVTNRRNDRFGGGPEERLRFAREVFSIVRETVGGEFPIGVRISGSEKSPGGLEIDDAKKLARNLEKWGADMIHVATGSNCESLPWYFQHMSLPPGVNEMLAAEVRREVGIPVMVAGRLGDPPRIREILDNEIIDMIALGRPLLADPDLPRKMSDGKDDEVMLCGHCLQGCFVNVKSGLGIGCNINPMVGHELDEVAPAVRPKRVVVIGGGPAGMQAALTAHRRGHRVTLLEKKQLGGQFSLAFLSPGKKRMEKPLHSMVRQVKRSGIEVRLGEEVTADKLKTINPDTVIIATGSYPIIPGIPGLQDPITAEEILTGSRETGSRVLVLGGGMVGVEVAEFLAKQDKQVIVVEILEEIARDMDPISRKMTMKRMAALPVEILTTTQVVRVENGHVFTNHQGEQSQLGYFDTIVVTAGNRSFNPLSDQLQKERFNIMVIGDADKPGTVYDAVNSGHHGGMAV